MNHEYKGPTPVTKGDKIELVAIDGQVYGEATVACALATQFMCNTKTNALMFFYADKGLTWRLKT